MWIKDAPSTFFTPPQHHRCTESNYLQKVTSEGIIDDTVRCNWLYLQRYSSNRITGSKCIELIFFLFTFILLELFSILFCVQNAFVLVHETYTEIISIAIPLLSIELLI